MLSSFKPTGLCLGLLCSISPAAAQGKITTTTAGGNGMTQYNCGNFFDLEVLNPKGLKITQFDISTRLPTNVRFFVDIYVTNDTYVGKDTNENLWSLVVDGSGVSAGPDAGTLSPVRNRSSTPVEFFLAPGKYGIHVLFRTGGTHYTDGTGSSGNQKVSNKDIALTLGIARSDKFGGTAFAPRVWNGAIHYAADNVGGSGYYGHGCLGSNNKVPGLKLDPDPKIGSKTKFVLFDMVGTGDGFLYVGFQKQEIDLAHLDMPGCTLNLSIALTLGFRSVNGAAETTSFSIPNDPSLVGTFFHAQSAPPDSQANAAQRTTSPGLSIRIGQ